MSITLELTPAEEARLREAASAHNLDLPEFLKISGLQTYCAHLVFSICWYL